MAPGAAEVEVFPIFMVFGRLPEPSGAVRMADVEIVGQPGSLAARNYLSWQKQLADLRLFIIFRPNLIILDQFC